MVGLLSGLTQLGQQGSSLCHFAGIVQSVRLAVALVICDTGACTDHLVGHTGGQGGANRLEVGQ
jgi:hypothetical protein